MKKNPTTPIVKFVKTNKNLILTGAAIGAVIGLVQNQRELFAALDHAQDQIEELTGVTTMIWETYVAQIDLDAILAK